MPYIWLLNCISKIRWKANQKMLFFFFSTENGGGHGWISSKADLVWYTYVVKAILEQLCSLLFFLILLKAMIFLLSYYILSFYHIWNILHIFPFLSGFVSDWEQFSKFSLPILGEAQKLSRHGPGQPAVGSPTSTRELDQVIPRSPFQHQPFCVSAQYSYTFWCQKLALDSDSSAWTEKRDNHIV